jgi:repressor LexA
MRGLSKRDKEVLDYIKKYMIDKGMTPTIREIGLGVNLYSTSSVHSHFKNLVHAGYITQIPDGKSSRYKVKGMKYIDEEPKDIC